MRNYCRYLCLILLLCAVQKGGFAQNFTEYSPLENTFLPVDFVNQSADRYIDLRQAYKTEGKVKHRERRQKEAFFLRNNYVIQDLFKSGVVLFDSSYSKYMKSIAAKVLDEDAFLLKNTQFYLVRSPAVNAFATQDGAVFIYMGLFATLHSEAELAFVISHELSHVRNQHALDFFIKSSNIAEKRGANARLLPKNGTKNLLATLNSYSQQNELAADEYGFLHYFAPSGYTLTAPNGVFDALRYNYLPFDNKPFEKAFWEDENLVFPQNYELGNIRRISSGTENEATERSTHPSIGLRRAQIRTLIEAQPTVVPQQDALVSAANFQAWKTRCRFELPMLSLHYNDFQEGIYAAYLLLHDTPNDLYLKKNIAKGLYAFAKFRNDTTQTAEAETVDYTTIEGEAQQLYHFLQQLDGSELTILALHYTQKLNIEYNDKELKTIYNNLINELNKYYFKNTKDIQRFIADNPEIYFSKTLDYLLKQPDFVPLYAKASRENNINTGALRNPAPISKIVVVGQNFKSIDTRKGRNSTEYSESMLGANFFEGAIAVNARKAKIDCLMLPTLPNADTYATRRLFNYRVCLNDWFTEQLAFDGIPFEGYQSERVQAIADSLDCDYFLWIGAVKFRQSKDGFGIFSNIAMMSIYPLFPFAAYSMANAEYDTQIYGVMYNVQTHQSRVLKYELVRGNLPTAVINSHLYDMFKNINP